MHGQKEFINLNKKILKIPGVGVEQMKEYKKNGCFTVNGVFYSNEKLTTKTVYLRTVLVLDIPLDVSLQTVVEDPFFKVIREQMKCPLDFIIHLSHPRIIQNSIYTGLSLMLQEKNPKCEHIYIHPEIAQHRPDSIENSVLYGSDFPNFFDFIPGILTSVTTFETKHQRGHDTRCFFPVT